jgi:GNAT superfamily N-acetyltransferase
MSASDTTWTVRPARADELPALAEIERVAGARFATIPEVAALPEVLMPPGALDDALGRGQVWVAVAAEGAPVGFAYADLLDGGVHLEELDVLPTWGRRGIGQALVAAVVADARVRGATAVTLTTIRDVPWNAPWYGRLGFRVLDPTTLPPGLAALVAHEDARGLPRALRVAMRRPIV